MSKKPQMAILQGDQSFQIEVVGESNYFENLRRVAGSNGRQDVEVVKIAYLVPEPTNPNDPNAVRVDVDQKVVGYIPRPVAAKLSPALRNKGLVGVQAVAKITAFKGATSYSVWIDGNLNEIIEEFGTPDRPWWRVW